MKDGYTYFVSNSQYRSYGLFTEVEEDEEENEDGKD
jgi:hypothetical protein